MSGSPKIRLSGTIQVPPDRLDAVRAALPEHIRLTLAEPGCISFDVREDETIQGQGRFWVSETFIDRTAYDAHQTRTKTSVWAEITAGIPRKYKIFELPD